MRPPKVGGPRHHPNCLVLEPALGNWEPLLSLRDGSRQTLPTFNPTIQKYFEWSGLKIDLFARRRVLFSIRTIDCRDGRSGCSWQGLPSLMDSKAPGSEIKVMFVLSLHKATWGPCSAPFALHGVALIPVVYLSNQWFGFYSTLEESF